MSASDIESKSAQNGEVGGSVVFSASRLILVENDVECPVQDVFDAPMFADNAQQFCGRVVLGQKEVALAVLSRPRLLVILATALRPGKSCSSAVSLTGATIAVRVSLRP